MQATPRCRTLMSVAFACSSFPRCSQAGAAVFTSARQDGQHLLETLRDGSDSQTMMLNYRKNGEIFQNLLTMR